MPSSMIMQFLLDVFYLNLAYPSQVLHWSCCWTGLRTTSHRTPHQRYSIKHPIAKLICVLQIGVAIIPDGEHWWAKVCASLPTGPECSPKLLVSTQNSNPCRISSGDEQMTSFACTQAVCVSKEMVRFCKAAVLKMLLAQITRR